MRRSGSVFHQARSAQLVLINDDDSCPSLVTGEDSDSESDWDSDSEASCENETEIFEEENLVEPQTNVTNFSAAANIAKLTYTQALSGVPGVQDPRIDEMGDPRDLRNYVPDSGATDDMTPRLEDLFDVVECQKLGVEVADGHIIKSTMTGKIAVEMLDVQGNLITQF